MPNLLSSHRRTFSLLSLLVAGGSLSASCTLDLKGQGTSSGGGTMSSSGMGTGGSMMACAPNEKKPCYTGAPATQGKGTCKDGEETCNADGSAFGPCFDQVLPEVKDDCASGIDKTCDGLLTCACNPKETKDCYDGLPATTKDVGICKGGTRTCNNDGTSFGECLGEVKPAVEDCTTQLDENCDGAVNEATSDCVCDPTMTAPSDCTTTQPGVCAGGTHMCAADGKSYSECISKLMPSFEDCFTQEDEDCDGKPAVTCSGTSDLASAIGTSTDDESVFGIATDAAGNIVLGGVSGSAGVEDYSVSSGAAEIIKLDKSGVLVWQKTYPTTGGGSYAVVRGVAVDSTGNVIVIGEYRGTINANGVSLTSTSGNSNSDAFVIKLGADGSPKWGKSYGTGGDQFGAGISAAANGDVFLIGTMSGTMTFGATMFTSNGSTDVFVARLDGASGDAKWAKNFGSSNPQYGWDVSATSDGNMVITGQSQGGVDFGGGNIAGGLDKDVFLAKLDGNNGSQVWAKTFGDVTDQVGYGVAADSNGNIALTGFANGKTNFGGGELGSASVTVGDLFVASFAPDGTHRWSKIFGDINTQVGRDVAVDAAGNVLVTGYFNGTLQIGGALLKSQNMNGGSTDVFVAKFRGSDGTPGWARSFGDVNDQVAWAVATDPSANVIFGGTFKGMIDFGPPTAPLTAMNNTYDSFWAKLAP